jgi:hypothetical protein
MESFVSITITNFPTRIAPKSMTAIDNFFIDISIIGKYELYPLINGLSGHDAQVLVINTILKPINDCYTLFKRSINGFNIANFQLNLSHESWELVFDETDVNKSFNIFLNIFLRNYYSSFPLIQTKKHMNQNSWITPGIITSCKHKREL